MLPRVLPFACYAAFIGLSSLLSSKVFGFSKITLLWVYPVKIAAVSGLLAYFWRHYTELRELPRIERSSLLLSVFVGALVYFAWVRMDFPWARQGAAGTGYQPFLAGPYLGLVLAGIRLFGTAVVVPMMEELFWRSFILRYVISTEFASVRLGAYTPASFLITAFLFGAEHDLWLAGIMAGAAYALLLYRTGRLWPVVLAHGLTNFMLGLHVLLKGEWVWW